MDEKVESRMDLGLFFRHQFTLKEILGSSCIGSRLELIMKTLFRDDCLWISYGDPVFSSQNDNDRSQAKYRLRDLRQPSVSNRFAESILSSRNLLGPLHTTSSKARQNSGFLCKGEQVDI